MQRCAGLFAACVHRHGLTCTHAHASTVCAMCEMCNVKTIVYLLDIDIGTDDGRYPTRTHGVARREAESHVRATEACRGCLVRTCAAMCRGRDPSGGWVRSAREWRCTALSGTLRRERIGGTLVARVRA